MKNNLLLIIAVIIIFGSSFLLKRVCMRDENTAAPDSGRGRSVQRIISLAPSITETVFLLGADHKLVGVTVYCNYPPEATKIARMGGYSTPDFEKIAMCRPDLIIMLEEHRKIDFERKFRRLGLDTLVVSTVNVRRILESVRMIGAACGVSERAAEITGDLEKRLETIRQQKKDPAPSVLVTVGRNMGGAGLESVFAAGKGTFYHDLLQILGAVNACPDTLQKYVQMSGEGILRSAPDIIIDIVPEASQEEMKEVVKAWNMVPGLKAYISVLSAEYCARPGPSFIYTLEDIRNEIRTWRRSIQ